MKLEKRVSCDGCLRPSQCPGDFFCDHCPCGTSEDGDGVCICAECPTTTPPPTTSPPPTPAPSGGGCFPSSAKVKLQNGKSVTMAELQVGDKVQTGTCILHYYAVFAM